MSRRKTGPAKPRVDWKPGDKAWRVDDLGRVHETTIRSGPWKICGHWSVKCAGVSGGYNEERFHRSLYRALLGGVKQAKAVDESSHGMAKGLVARAEHALGAYLGACDGSGEEPAALVALLRGNGHIEVPITLGRHGEGGAA